MRRCEGSFIFRNSFDEMSYFRYTKSILLDMFTKFSLFGLVVLWSFTSQAQTVIDLSLGGGHGLLFQLAGTHTMTIGAPNGETNRGIHGFQLAYTAANKRFTGTPADYESTWGTLFSDRDYAYSNVQMLSVGYVIGMTQRGTSADTHLWASFGTGLTEYSRPVNFRSRTTSGVLGIDEIHEYDRQRVLRGGIYSEVGIRFIMHTNTFKLSILNVNNLNEMDFLYFSVGWGWKFDLPRG